jgi:hypothetical protein
VVSKRKERAGDEGAIHNPNVRAFGRREEAEVVDALRRTCPEGVSPVAEADGRTIGHILFKPASIEGGASAPRSSAPFWRRFAGWGNLTLPSSDLRRIAPASASNGLRCMEFGADMRKCRTKRR